MNSQLAGHFRDRLIQVQETFTAVRLKPWADELMVLVPQNRPEDFAHFVHFLEGLVAAFGHFERFVVAQGTHEEQTVRAAIAALHTLTYEARTVWNDYKQRAAIAGHTDGYGA